MENIFNLPESFESEYELYRIPMSSKKLLIMSDTHLPFHNIDALTICLSFAKKEKIDSILLNGDIFDFYKLSKFTQDPRKVDLITELKIGGEFLDVLQKTFPKAKIYFKIGNHEERLRTYLKIKAPELWGLPSFNYDEFLQLRSRGIELIDNNRIVMSGKLPILHGHEIRLGAGAVNVARSLFIKFKASSVTSHLHQTSGHTETDGMGKTISTHSIGCLCELHPEYAPINRWNHGFAINEIDETGGYEFRNYKIVKGRVV